MNEMNESRFRIINVPPLRNTTLSSAETSCQVSGDEKCVFKLCRHERLRDMRQTNRDRMKIWKRRIFIGSWIQNLSISWRLKMKENKEILDKYKVRDLYYIIEEIWEMKLENKYSNTSKDLEQKKSFCHRIVPVSNFLYSRGFLVSFPFR